MYDSDGNTDALRLASDKMTELLAPYLESALESAREKGDISIGNAGFTARFIIHGSLGALNAGEGTPHELIQKSMAHLPETIARILGMGPRKLTPGKEV